MEEQYLFPILGKRGKLIKKVSAEHRRLRRLFIDIENTYQSLNLIEKELERHISSQEWIIFNEIRRVVTEEQLEMISKVRDHGKFNDNTDDPF